MREVSRDEAAGVLAFWNEASGDPQLSDIHVQAMQNWRSHIAHWVSQGQESGELTRELPADSMAGALVGFMLGTQIVLTVEPEQAGEGTLRAQLAAILDGFTSAAPVASAATS